jgi:hypothetical protein
MEISFQQIFFHHCNVVCFALACMQQSICLKDYIFGKLEITSWEFIWTQIKEKVEWERWNGWNCKELLNKINIIINDATTTFI